MVPRARHHAGMRHSAQEFVRTFLVYMALLLGAGAIAGAVGELVELVGLELSAASRSGLGVLLFVLWLTGERVKFTDRRASTGAGAG